MSSIFDKNVEHLYEFNLSTYVGEENLVVFDDLALETNQSVIDNYAIRCRHMNVSMIYISQDWFKCSPCLRRNLSLILLKHIAKQSDLDKIYQNCDSIAISKEKFRKIYKFATKSDDENDPNDKSNFLLIDCYAPNPANMYRRNLKVIDTDAII